MHPRCFAKMLHCSYKPVFHFCGKMENNDFKEQKVVSAKYKEVTPKDEFCIS